MSGRKTRKSIYDDDPVEDSNEIDDLFETLEGDEYDIVDSAYYIADNVLSGMPDVWLDEPSLTMINSILIYFFNGL